MSYIVRKNELSYERKSTPVPEYTYQTSVDLARLAQCKKLHVNIRQLDPGKYNCPFHFHRNAEEYFVILSGKCILRTQEGFEELCQGDMVFFEMGPSGAHQLYNHTHEVCEYIDLRTEEGIDICEYPDSGKVLVYPIYQIYETKDQLDYFKGEDKVAEKWADFMNTFFS